MALPDLSKRGGIHELPVEKLRELAADFDVEGRADMNKAALVKAINKIRDKQLVALEKSQGDDNLQAERKRLRPRRSFAAQNEQEPVDHQAVQRMATQRRIQGAVGAPQSGAPNPDDWR